MLKNLISINPVTIKSNSTIKINTLKVVPTEGAVVMAKFNSHTGKSVLFKISSQDGSLIPFGSIATVNKGKDNNPVTGIVNENGSVYVSGISQVGIVNVMLGKGKSCTINYNLTNVKPHHDIYNIGAVCK